MLSLIRGEGWWNKVTKNTENEYFWQATCLQSTAFKHDITFYPTYVTIDPSEIRGSFVFDALSSCLAISPDLSGDVPVEQIFSGPGN